MRTIPLLLLGALSAAAIAESARGEDGIPEPPTEREAVMRLLGALTSPGRGVPLRIMHELRRHARLAGPLLRERLADPDLPNWSKALSTLAEIAPDYIHPETGQTLQAIARQFDSTQVGMRRREDIVLGSFQFSG